MKLKALLGSGVVAGAMLFTSVAGAAVTFDAATGTGFVGKGDVQTPLGLNNKQMQAVVSTSPSSLTWSYGGSQTYEFDCEWDTGQKNVTHHVNTKEVTRTVSATVDAVARKTGQWTGWHITVGAITGGQGLPVDADCGAEGNGMKTIVPGSIVAVGDETAPVLSVTYQGQTVLLPVTL